MLLKERFDTMRLSIITINYNNAEGLRKTLASVASQTYPYIEHVIVDGGSTDDSVEIIRQYADNQAKGERLEAKGTGNEVKGEENGEADSNNNSTPIYTNLYHSTPSTHIVRWISEPDKGIYNAMNKGIEIALGRRVVNSFNRSELVEDKNKGIRMATGDYIQILNSGDILVAHDVTERMMAALSERNEKINNQQSKQFDNQQLKQSTSDIVNIVENKKSASPAIFYGNMIKEYPDGKRIIDKCLGDRNILTTSVREIEWTMYDFIKGTINHDPTYIHRSLYEKFGLYDEKLKIVSDWKWFVNAVVFGGEKVFYAPIDVTIFDMTGISETNLIEREKERNDELEKMLPIAILKDYHKYRFPIYQYNHLQKYHLWSIVYFIERVLFKLEKWKIIKR